MFESEGDFGAELDGWVKKTEAQFKSVVREFAGEVQKRVISKMPVDSGRARASWNLSVGTPDLTVAPEPAKRGSKKAALANAQEAKKSLPDFDPFVETVWLTNAVPYILLLENGSSQKAPRGMVSVTIAEVESGIVLRIF